MCNGDARGMMTFNMCAARGGEEVEVLRLRLPGGVICVEGEVRGRGFGGEL